jgi:hypothetical protein
MVVLAGIYWLFVSFDEQGRCPLGRLTGSPLASAGSRHSTLLPGIRKHDRPAERPWFLPISIMLKKTLQARGMSDQRSGAAPHYCRTLRLSGVNPSVERTCLQDGQKPSTLPCMVKRRVIGHFCGVFLLDMRSKCGRVGARSSTAPFRAAVAAVVPEEAAAHARAPRLAASTPLRCPRRPHARPFPTQAQGSTAPARGLRWRGGRASEACPRQRSSGPPGLPASSKGRP